MKQLARIAPAQLFDDRPAVVMDGVRYPFDTQDEAARFQAHNDVALVRMELQGILLNCRYFKNEVSAAFHTGILRRGVEVLKTFAMGRNMPEMVDYLETEVSPSIDALQALCGQTSLSIISQAKALVVLFISKYKV